MLHACFRADRRALFARAPLAFVLLAFALIVAPSLLAAPFPSATPQSQGLSGTAVAQLERHVAQLVVDDELVGAEILVLKNRRKVLHRAFGYLDREQSRHWRPGGIAGIRGMGKPLIGTAACLLMDEGRLAPEAKVGSILTAFAGDWWSELTIDHLLTHADGLGRAGDALGSSSSLRDLATAAASLEPEFPPGTSFHYGDTATDVLGAVIEQVTGASLEVLLAERLLGPLGMTDTLTSLRDGDPHLERLASVYSGAPGAWVRGWRPGDPTPPFFLASQGVFTTAEDYARLLAPWMDHGRLGEKRLLSADVVRHALRPRVKLPAEWTSFADLEPHAARHWLVHAPRGSRRPVTLGHAGADGAAAWAWPEQDLIVVFLSQCNLTPVPLELEGIIEALLIDGRAQHPSLRTASGAARLTAFAGIYWDDDEKDRYSVVRPRGAHLVVERPGRGLVVLQQTDQPERFLAPTGATVTFERDEAGRVTGARVADAFQSERHPRYLPELGLADADRLGGSVARAHGMDRLPQSGGVRLDGTIDVPRLDASGSVSMLFDARRQRIEMQAGSRALRTVVDGDRAWYERATVAAHELDGPFREQVLLEHPAARFGDWSEHFGEARVLRRTTLDGREVWVVHLQPRLGRSTTKFVSVRSGLVVGEDRIVDLPGYGTVGLMARYSDFRRVGPLRLPFRLSFTYANELVGSLSIRYENAQAGVALPRDAFAPLGREPGS